MSDQHHAGAMGCAGSRNVETPNLDRVAAGGIRFRDAFANSPICGPSRCCFLTGQQTWRHGVVGNLIRGFEGAAEANIARTFREAGYTTGLAGKAHLPARWTEEGFDWIRLSDLADADPRDPLSCDYFAHLVDQGMGDYYDQGALPEGHPGHGMRAFTSRIPYRHSLEAWTGREARSFLERHDADEPFFLKVSFQRPHDPYAPSPDHPLPVDPGKLVLPTNAGDAAEGMPDRPAFQRDYVRGPLGSGYPYRPEDEEDLRWNLARYVELVRAIDHEIGGILDLLGEQGRLDDTIIAYVADHGDFAGDHGLLLKNLGVYESIQRIPFLLRYPGGPKGRVVSGLVESVDFAPTLCELAGLDVPESMDGRSLLREIEGTGSGKAEAPCYWEHPGDAAGGPQQKVIALRTPERRFVRYLSTGEEELYDHTEDPGEQRNLAVDPAETETLARFRARAEKLLRDAVFRHTPQDDLRARTEISDSPVFALHRKAARWSELRADCRGNR